MASKPVTVTIEATSPHPIFKIVVVRQTGTVVVTGRFKKFRSFRESIQASCEYSALRTMPPFPVTKSLQSKLGLSRSQLEKRAEELEAWFEVLMGLEGSLPSAAKRSIAEMIPHPAEPVPLSASGGGVKKEAEGSANSKAEEEARLKTEEKAATAKAKAEEKARLEAEKEEATAKAQADREARLKIEKELAEATAKEEEEARLQTKADETSAAEARAKEAEAAAKDKAKLDEEARPKVQEAGARLQAESAATAEEVPAAGVIAKRKEGKQKDVNAAPPSGPGAGSKSLQPPPAPGFNGMDDLDSAPRRQQTMVKREKDGESEISCYSGADTACTASGPLMKLSTKKQWQRRYFEIRGPFLMVSNLDIECTGFL